MVCRGEGCDWLTLDQRGFSIPTGEYQEFSDGSRYPIGQRDPEPWRNRGPFTEELYWMATSR